MRRRLSSLTPEQQVFAALAAAGAVGVVVAAVPVLANVGLLLACTAVVAALAVLAQWLWQSQHATDWSNTFTESAPPRGADSRINRLAERIQQADSGDPQAAADLHGVIRGLALERLRDQRGQSLDSDPDAARALLGPELAAYLAQPPTTRMPTERLTGFITTLEEL